MTLMVHRAETAAEDAALPGMVGEHPLMKEVYRLVRRVAPTELPALIVGETGTGKELVARAFHELSGRAGRFVAVNICAIPDTMFEDALFGHVRGAFTGAATGAPGLLMEADRGTLFLDEIGGLGILQQAKLLRAIETHEFRPVGGPVDRRSDFRAVAATNADPRELIRQGRFRRDLFDRLHGAAVAVPRLRDRSSDVPLLAAHFLAHVNHGRLRFSTNALEALTARDWPGNVRELCQLVGRLAATAEDDVIPAEAVPCSVAADDGELRAAVSVALVEANWDVRAAAARLGVSRATLYRMIRRCGLRRSGPWSQLSQRRLETIETNDRPQNAKSLAHTE
jgi:DNA-binding NtrC family response regulator